MLNIIGKIPRNVTVAVSGGADSMAVLDFLKNSHEVTVAYYHHGTEHGEEALDLVRKYCTLHELPHIIGKRLSGGSLLPCTGSHALSHTAIKM